ncbi:MAG: ribonuclease HII [Candidatus Saccharimonas sp.]
MILGIDEVGRGPWAGPLVVGAVVLGGVALPGLTDSKKVTKKQREQLTPMIHEQAQAVALGWVSANELDTIGMSAALQLATRRAVEQITVPYHEIIIDGTVNFLVGTALEKYVTTLPKADALVPSVSAASIVAKVARDAYMAEQDNVYSGYGFTQHAGYGVAKHRAAIERHGVTPLHRLSFAPLQKYAAPVASVVTVRAQKEVNARQTSRVIGNNSEAVAATYLQHHGHVVIERNWKTKYCEIDIISQKGDTIYFTEVKHRNTNSAGDGLAAITPTKLRKMKFAAELYASRLPQAYNLRLSVIATTGSSATVQNHLHIG